MLDSLLVGSGLIVATVVVHSIATAVVISLVKVSSARGWNRAGLVKQVALVSTVVLLLCYASLVESAIWAAYYVFSGALEHMEEALYFSTVTFTTLGYGDVTVGDQWRLLASIESANGIIMFGWTTALVVALLQHVIRREPLKGETQSGRTAGVN